MLRQSEEKYRNILGSIEEGYFETDLKGNFTFCNDALCKILGYDKDEAQGINYRQYVDRINGKKLFTNLVNIFKTGQPVSDLDWEITRKDTTKRCVESSMSLISNGAQKPIGFRGLVRDVTERKLAEVELALESNLMQVLMDNIPDAIYFKDTQSRFVRVSKHVHLKGIKSPEDAIGKTDFDFFAEEHAQPYFDDEQRIVQSGEPIIDQEQKETFPDGTSGWVSSTKVPIFDAKGKVTGIVGLSRDITERKHAEEAMQNSRDYLERIINAVGDPIFVNDRQHRMVLVNDAFCQIMGRAKEEIIGKSPADTCLPDEAQIFIEMDNLVFESGKETSNEEQLTDKHGNRRVIMTKKTVYEAPNGEQFIVGVIRDITENKQAEVALRENEAKFRDLFDNAPVAYHELDREGRFLHINHTEELLLGYTNEELIGRHPSEIIVEKVSREAIAAKLTGTMQLHPVERTFIRKDGSLVSVLNEDRIIYDKKGNVAGIRSTLQNITERKRIEERQSAILDALPAHICLLDNAGNILEVNNEWKQFALVNSYSGVNFGIGSNYIETCENATGDCAEGAKQVADICRAVLSGDSSHFEMEYPCHSPNEERWFKLTVSPLNKENLAGAVVMHVNITERKKMEEELKQTRDLALESVRLKSEFLANMSHEIRTPMNGVIGMTELLQDTDLSVRQQEFTKTIETSADALLTIIDDILDFSKIEAGQLRFEIIDFDLQATIEQPVEMLAQRAQSKGIEIASLVYRDVPTQLCGDPGRLRQILTNLIGNAIKFTEKGEVTVNVRKQGDEGKYVLLRFEVTDTGIGISERAQRRLFQAFVQADGSMTRKYGGTGLGLAISKQLVEMMGGEIGIESAPGIGSTFWFTARFEKQPNQSLAIPAVGNVSLEGVRVLVVDDTATNRKILLHQTASWGMMAAEAGSGEQALEQMRAAAARNEPFKIAILDLMMPEMDGFELARAIKSEAALSATNLMLLTSYGKRGDGQIARESGIAGYLQKPVRQSQLYNCLMTVIADASGNENDHQLPPLITKHSLRSKTLPNNKFVIAASKARILVAEDNLVNQKVALSQLKSLGYSADVVSNGRKAIEILENSEYDLILMDCQMPEMDGFEATAEIRRREGKLKHTIIIAMTANALDGDREICLAAGMDDYISKPVKLETLTQTLNRWLVPTSTEQVTAEPEETIITSADNDRHQSVDLSVLNGFRDLQQPNEPEIVTELIDLFLDDAGRRITALKKSVAGRKITNIKEQAHGIKGSSSNIGAFHIAALCKKFEEEVLNITQIKSLITEIEDEFQVVTRILKDLRRSTQPAV
ncbi:MAG: PAS domain S-box protein [Actinomycetota bacterium]